MYSIWIKHMVCPRCIMAVQKVMDECGVRVKSISLGEVTMEEPPSDAEMTEIHARLERLGFEILNDPRRQMVERIGTTILEWVNMSNERPRLSALLSDKMSCDYTLLSKSFTEVKGITIEQYMKLLRIERVKEELCYGEKSIAEISYLLGFSSPAHLSTQFKSVTGLSPRAFQLLEKDAKTPHGRKPLDMI